MAKNEIDIIREEESARTKTAISNLSNMIFGLALSLGTFTFITSGFSNLGNVLNNLFIFAFSFILLFFIWIRYTGVFEVMRIDNRMNIVLHGVILFFVVIEPYLYGLMASGSNTFNAATTSLFAFDMTVLMLALGYAYNIGISYIDRSRKETIRRYRMRRDSMLVSGTIFAISLIPQLLYISVEGIPVRFILWIITLPAASMVFRLGRKAQE